MDRPIHDVLDGKRDRGEITTDEREELAALESAIGSIAGPLVSAPVPDFAERVMTRIIEMESKPSRLARWVGGARDAAAWVWAPWPVKISIRPAYALGALGMVSLLALLTPFPRPLPLQPPVAEGEQAAPQVYVQFRLETDAATHVALAGSFTGWMPEYELRETVPGTWSILLPLPPGIHDYTFIVDGSEWVADPHALQIDDGFGGVNSRIALPSLPASSQRS